MIAHSKQSLVPNDFQCCRMPNQWLCSQRLTIQKQVFNDLLLGRLANVLEQEARLDEVVIQIGPGGHNMPRDCRTLIGGNSEALVMLRFPIVAVAKFNFDNQVVGFETVIRGDWNMSHSRLPS